MPPNTSVFLLGLIVGTSLLLIGLLLGYWLGKSGSGSSEPVDRRRFLEFLNSLSSWTSEFSGDVSRFQSELSDLSVQVRSGDPPPQEEIVALLSSIMKTNQRLQERIDSAERKLESQTDQISSYLTEARTDALTALPNRRAFDQSAEELFEAYRRHGNVLCLGLIDIDYFKQINDTHGHPAGDAVLKRLATVLECELSIAHCLARYGGEEFAMVALHSLEQTATAIDRVRQSIAELPIQHEALTIRVTLSAGVACIERDEGLNDLLQRADEALYAAKVAGRNRVYLHDGETCRLFSDIDGDQSTDTRATISGSSDGASQSGDGDAEQDPRYAKLQSRLQRIVAEESQRLIERS